MVYRFILYPFYFVESVLGNMQTESIANLFLILKTSI